MRGVIQRVRWAGVSVRGGVVGRIGPGSLGLLGVAAGDGEEQCRWLADKTAHLRIFADEQGRMNRSLLDLGREEDARSLLEFLGEKDVEL